MERLGQRLYHDHCQFEVLGMYIVKSGERRITGSLSGILIPVDTVGDKSANRIANFTFHYLGSKYGGCCNSMLQYTCMNHD